MTSSGATRTSSGHEPKPRTLNDKHRGELHASGLTNETINAAGIYSACDGEIARILGWQPRIHHWGDGLVIPYRDDYLRVKLDFSRHDEKGKPIRYESPRKAANQAYFPPGFSMPRGPEFELVITEGEKKCLRVAQEGIPCIGLVGVWGWQARRNRTDTGKGYGPRKLIPGLAALDWRGMNVVIVFDSDAATNSAVQLAESRLAEVLTAAGAIVRVARIPATGEAKVGVDDFIVAHGAEAFRALLQKAEAAETPNPPTPMDWARMFISERCMRDEGETLRHHRDEFFAYDGRRYREFPDSDLRGHVLQFIDERGAKATKALASDVLACMASEVAVPFYVDPPVMLDDHGNHRPNLIAMYNGLLSLDELLEGKRPKLIRHTPRYFNTVALPYEYRADAMCPKWIEAIDSILTGDPECIAALRQWFGYVLTSDTSLHAILLLEGPPRTGKSTILRVMRAVIGEDNCCSPCLTQLTEPFGKAALLGKRLATVNDAHLGHGDKAIAVLEMLKAITGEDGIDVNRKNRAYLTNVRLGVRFALACNELPRFGDSANALTARQLMLLSCRNSFVGREDHGLEGKLLAELSGIFNWAIEGLRHLRAAGRFIIPKASVEIISEFARLTSPHKAFIEDRCKTGPTESVSRDALYEAWRRWCEANGHLPGGKDTFGSKLRTLVPGLRTEQHRTPYGRERVYCWIGLNYE